MISVVLLVTCVFSPLNFAFQDEFEKIVELTILNYSIDFIFFIDILVQFNSPYLNEFNAIVDSRKEIAKTYIKSWFFIDVISIFPIEVLAILLDKTEETTR